MSNDNEIVFRYMFLRFDETCYSRGYHIRCTFKITHV